MAETMETGFLTQVAVVQKGKFKPAILTLSPTTLQLDYLSRKQNKEYTPLIYVIGALSDVQWPNRFKVCFYDGQTLQERLISCIDTQMSSDWVQRIMQFAYPDQLSPRRIAVLVNPISGKKKAVKLFRKCFLPMLEFACVSCAYFETDSSDFVSRWCMETDLSIFTEIVVFGGDGLLHQLLNGLLIRGRLDIPIGVVPAGSQNALACAISGKNPYQACLYAIKGIKCPGDLLRLHIDDKEIVASSAVAWGIVSDIVREAQSLRQFGTSVPFTQRYTLCGIKKFMSPWKKYKARLRFIPVDLGNFDTFEDVDDEDGEWKGCSGPFEFLAIVNHQCPSSLSNEMLAPEGRIDDGLMDLLAVFSAGRVKMVKLLMRMQVKPIQKQGEHVNLQNLIYKKTRAVCIEPESTLWFNVDGEPYQAHKMMVEVWPKAVTYLGSPLALESRPVL